MSSGMHDLDVGEVMAVVARAVRDQRGLDRVQRLADRAVAQRMEMRLEAERVQLGHGVLQQFRVDERDARFSVGWPVRVEVRRQRRRREVLDDAVLHDLHAGRREPPHASPRPGVDQPFDLLEPAMTVPPERPDHTSGELAVVGRRDVRIEGPIAAVDARRCASCQAVIPSEWRYVCATRSPAA